MYIAEILNYIFWLNAIIAVIIIILDNRPPEVSISWILIILFFPGLGLVLFALFGINWKKTKLTRQNPETLFSHNLETILNNQKHFFSNKDIIIINMPLSKTEPITETCHTPKEIIMKLKMIISSLFTIDRRIRDMTE